MIIITTNSDNYRAMVSNITHLTEGTEMTELCPIMPHCLDCWAVLGALQWIIMISCWYLQNRSDQLPSPYCPDIMIWSGVVSYYSIVRMTDIGEDTEEGWECLSQLGSGGFGIVHVWRNVRSGRTVALKKCKVSPSMIDSILNYDPHKLKHHIMY